MVVSNITLHVYLYLLLCMYFMLTHRNMNTDQSMNEKLLDLQEYNFAVGNMPALQDTHK